MVTTQKIESVVVGMTFEYDPSAPLPEDLQAIVDEYDSGDDAQAGKTLYAAAGFALYWSQLFEVEIELLILTFKKANGTLVNVQDFEVEDLRLSERTLGQLIGEVRRIVQLDKNGETLIEMARSKRNVLAHRFFEDHSMNLTSPAGRRLMLRELLEYARLFRIAERLSKLVTGVCLQSLGYDRKQLDTVIEQLYSSDGMKTN